MEHNGDVTNCSCPVMKAAHIFDGNGHYEFKEWDLIQGTGKDFCWYHFELPKGNRNLTHSAQHLIDALCPPLNLQDIIYLLGNSSFCGHVEGALIFRVKCAGLAYGKFSLRFAARVTENHVITVSLGRFPRVRWQKKYDTMMHGIPIVGRPGDVVRNDRIVIKEYVLDFLLVRDGSEEVDDAVPRCVSSLVVHVINSYIYNLQNVLTTLESELNTVELELELDSGSFALKKQLLDNRKFPKMLLDLQQLLQTIADGERVFSQVKEKCRSKGWFGDEDIICLEELIGQIRRLKEKGDSISNRVTTIQTGLGCWQAEQMNKRLYCFIIISIIFLPISIMTAVKGGFVNVVMLSVAMLGIVLLYLFLPTLYSCHTEWSRSQKVYAQLRKKTTHSPLGP